MSDEPQTQTKKDDAKKLDARALKACEAYGIDPAYVLTCTIDPDTREVILLTHGGASVVWKEGKDKFIPLTEIQVTGVNRELEARRAALGR